MKYQIQYQSDEHPKGSDYWQTTRTFKTVEAAKREAEKTRAALPSWRIRVIEKS